MKYFYLIVLTFIIAACGSKNEQSDNEYVNSWIYKNMSTYYLWNEELPKSVDYSMDPKSFFNSLLFLYGKLDGDRFSVIMENYIDLLNASSGVISRDLGFEFQLYQIGNSNQLIGEIAYVKPNTPASKTNIKRGDFFTHIDGELININNYYKLLTDERMRLTFTFSNSEEKTQDIIIHKVLNYAENPIYLDTIYTISSKKTGYLIYNFFAPDEGNGSSAYDLQLNSVFTKFKSERINELIIDLRYNSGGYISSAVNLASMVVQNLNTSNICVRYQHNNLLSKQLNDSLLFKDKIGTTTIANIGEQLSKVYVITSKASASASELLINSLRPYMDVVLVGDTTMGKDVGSFALYEKNDTRNTWGIQPITFRYYNSASQPVPTTGFIPKYEVPDNFDGKFELGDTQERLLSNALNHILPAQRSINRQSNAEIGTPILLKKNGTVLMMKTN